MGEDVKHPLRGPGLSPACLQGKKGLLSTRAYEFACGCARVRCSLIGNIVPPSPVLVSAVSDAVEAILGQFSSSRTVVQKVSQCWSSSRRNKNISSDPCSNVLFHLRSPCILSPFLCPLFSLSHCSGPRLYRGTAP